MHQNIREFPAFRVNGFIVLGLAVAVILGWGWWIFSNVHDLQALLGRALQVGDFLGDDATAEIVATAIATILVVVIPSISGFLSVEPNQAVVLTFLGSYVGTIREPGFWWINPFTRKQVVSLRVRNFNSKIIKVNDAEGSPIEIAAVVVWQVLDSSKSKFSVDDYQEFVAIQSETAIRALAIRYPYDTPDSERPSLRGIPEEIAQALQNELQARLEVAGVEIIEARLSHLAYAPEIAQVMLRRQQAKALIDARRQIVEGAVGMVNEALNKINESQMLELDDERKAAMINNLLVVLTSEQTAQPVVNTGSLYN
ncbi:SPFH domain-containing protein [Calothrix sp. 336/3]|uniref:SPFH domain-containing protein n=1 Tax=Calothrix sp. 336/3 TaxID=1337936 RepID=UPI0004E3827C|nr:SPFH domain-containing protein [Calothrix sp. 336/3]AKG22005.1 membrane protein [Calothrix sp. 336/3]